MSSYGDFLQSKVHRGSSGGFSPTFMPGSLYDFQIALVTWALERGRAAIFADCGLGKTPMQLTWAENVVRKTNKPVLVLTPLSVGAQTVREAGKFGIEAARSHKGEMGGPMIVVANYERLHYFNRHDFSGVVCDESSILKNFDGATKAAVTEFMRETPYRLLCTATASPNDYIELGTSSEALGELGFMDMLSVFFKKQEKTLSKKDELRSGVYRFRGHAEKDFWRWVSGWSRAIRKPSDLGYEDGAFVLPEMSMRQHIVTARTPREDMLFDFPAVTLEEQRQERRRTLTERCEKAAELVLSHDGPSVAWCHLNDEGDTLERMIPGSVQVSGGDADEAKEYAFEAFSRGEISALITKPTIAGYGLNWQHCAHQTFFPSHSFEQFYQAVRRSWRFGQKRTVHIDVITSEGESRVLQNMQRKADQADKMFENLVSLINDELHVHMDRSYTNKEKVPSWL